MKDILVKKNVKKIAFSKIKHKIVINKLLTWNNLIFLYNIAQTHIRWFVISDM